MGLLNLKSNKSCDLLRAVKEMVVLREQNKVYGQRLRSTQISAPSKLSDRQDTDAD